jgi:phosphatidylinositol alpha 1,6-mannosyltransferase
VGAAADLVSPGWNGVIVPPADVGALTQALKTLVSDPDRRAAFGENSRLRAQDWVPARGAERWVDLAERVLARGRMQTVGTKP